MGVALGKAGNDTSALDRGHKRFSGLERKLWLPKTIYVAIPYFYLACGICAFLATLYIAEWFWLLPHYVLFSFACVHAGIAIYRRRAKRRTREPERRAVQRRVG